MSKKNRSTPGLYFRFIGALFSGGTADLGDPRPTGSLKGWGKAGLQSVVAVASSQLDAQLASLDRTLSRAQLLFTTVLALGAFLFATAPAVWASSTDMWGELVPRVVWLAAGVLMLLSLLGTTALIAIRKRYEGMSATVLSTWESFDEERFAREYAECVGEGELTTNAHLTVFGASVRLSLYGALCLGAAWAMTQLM